MLALSRKQGESIVIGNNIEITVLEAKGDQVKIQEENREAVANLDVESLKKLL